MKQISVLDVDCSYFFFLIIFLFSFLCYRYQFRICEAAHSSYTIYSWPIDVDAAVNLSFIPTDGPTSTLYNYLILLNLLYLPQFTSNRIFSNIFCKLNPPRSLLHFHHCKLLKFLFVIYLEIQKPINNSNI